MCLYIYAYTSFIFTTHGLQCVYIYICIIYIYMHNIYIYTHWYNTFGTMVIIMDPQCRLSKSSQSMTS